MKKFVIFMLTIAMLVTMLTACGKKKNQVEEGKNEAQIESIAPEKEEKPEVSEKPEEDKKPQKEEKEFR